MDWGLGFPSSWQYFSSELCSLFAFSNIGDVCISEIPRVDIFRLINESMCSA